MKKLGVNTAEIEQLTVQPVTPRPEAATQEETTINQPIVISGDLSEDEQKAAFDRLPSGALFVDPSDGLTYRKP